MLRLLVSQRNHCPHARALACVSPPSGPQTQLPSYLMQRLAPDTADASSGVLDRGLAQLPKIASPVPGTKVQTVPKIVSQGPNEVQLCTSYLYSTLYSGTLCVASGPHISERLSKNRASIARLSRAQARSLTLGQG